MRLSKTKAIQADLGIFTHILADSGIFWQIQTYSSIIGHMQKLFWHAQVYSLPSVTLAYSEPWNIQNHAILIYSPSYNLTPPIYRVLIGQHSSSDWSPTCCNSSRKCTPVKYKTRQKAGFPVVT